MQKAHLRSRIHSREGAFAAIFCLTLMTLSGTGLVAAAIPGQFLTGPNGGDPLEIATDYLLEHHGSLGLTATDLADFEVSSRYVSQHTQTTHIALQQRSAGIGVYNAIITVNIARDGSVINVGNRFLSDLESKITGPTVPSLTAVEAVERVAGHLGLEIGSPLEATSNSDGAERETRFSPAGISHVEIPARLTYQPDGDSVRLAWEVEIQELRSYDHWSLRIDATTGEELGRHNMTVHDSWMPKDKSLIEPGPAPLVAVCSGSGDGDDDYCVYAMPVESPHHADPNPDGSERTMESDTWLESATASTLGWNDIDGAPGADGNLTQGNNANAQKSGTHADGGPNRIFNFDLDLTSEPTAGSNVDAAITNLYFWNNILHDLWQDYGFDEASGNFQEFNYSGMGIGGDSVNANAQAPGNCNATFGTPPDGSNPSMNMFICNIASPSRDGDFDNGVIAHEFWHGITNRLTGGPANVSCLNNSEQAGEGWSDLGGLVMTIEPGDVGTDSRGIGTWLLGTGPDGPGVRTLPYSTDLAVNDHTYNAITSLSIPHGVGEVWATIYWEVVWALIDEYGFNPDFYGDWTTGGNNLANQLLLDGLKLQPCSPGFVDNRDAILLADTNLTGGANQCILWEAFAKRGLGFSADQGSSGSRSDQTEGYDIPSFCDFIGAVPETVEVCAGSDAEFDLTFGTAWTPPVTLSVVSPPAGTTNDFSLNPIPSVPNTSTLTIGNTGGLGNSTSNFMVRGDDTSEIFDLSLSLVSYAGASGPVTLTSPTDGETNVAQQPTLTWTAAANGGTYSVEVATDVGFTNIVASDASVTGTSWMVPISLNTATTYYWRVQATNTCGTSGFSAPFEFLTTTGPGDCDIGVAATVAFNEGFESGAGGWTTDGLGSTWAISGTNTHTGSAAFHADNVGFVSDQYLISPALALPSANESPITARFWMAQEVEDGGPGCYDGAVAEISTNGVDWTRLESEILAVPYDGLVSGSFSNPIGGSNAWCGDPRDWEQVIIDLDAWAGQTVNLRIRFATDSSVDHPGMEIDDFAIQSCLGDDVFADGFESGDVSAWSTSMGN